LRRSSLCGRPPGRAPQPEADRRSLIKSTAARDRGFKFQEFKKIVSLEQYVLVSQTEPRIERSWRPPGGVWSAYSETRGLDSTLVLESLGIEIRLAEIYEDIEFDSTAAS
jgi:Uma2 family endonuclease